MNTALNGLNIAQSSSHLRHYLHVEKARHQILAGWFLRLANYEIKYKLAYHLYDSSEHVTWILNRLSEMRAGNPNASVRPELADWCNEAIHAPNDRDFLAGFYGVVTRELLHAIVYDLSVLDASGNANEVRLLERIATSLRSQLTWFDSLGIDVEDSPWAAYLRDLFRHAKGMHGEKESTAKPERPQGPRFQRPETIHFDSRITVGPLVSYEERQEMDPREATIEQFKVFFNEFYAAALLASILHDAHQGDYPWDMQADFSRHFWDEVRHSEFGYIRLKELNAEPDRVNPILFEQSQGLPLLHRITYLTRGLEAYFMPRKPKRMKEYEANGDERSQLFADQDWSDEINHVRYGSRWTDHLLKDDYREIGDIIEECKEHLSKVRGEKVTDISAPF